MKKIRVLVIEDYSSARELLKVLLEAENYEVLEAADGREGLELALSTKPNLVIVDLMVPEIDGKAVIKKMKKDDLLKETPIMVVTAQIDALDDLRDQLGVENVFTKPFEPLALLDRVGHLVGHPDD